MNIKSRQRQIGTTLIEVMISMVLLTVGLLGLVALHARSLQTAVDSENRANAALAANEIITAMWLSHSATNSTKVATAWNSWQSVTTRSLPQGQYTISVPDANGAVTVTLNWTAPGQQTANQTVTNQYFTTVAIP